MGASDYRMSNATDHTVDFIISGKNLELKSKKEHTQMSAQLNPKIAVKSKQKSKETLQKPKELQASLPIPLLSMPLELQASGSLPLKYLTRVDDNRETENVIEAKYSLGPGETTQIILENISESKRLTIIVNQQGKKYLLRENIIIPSNPLLGGRLVVYLQDNCFRIGKIADGKNWLMQKGNSGSTTQRNYPPGIKCEYCSRSRACTRQCRLSTFYSWKYTNRWREGSSDYNGPPQ